MGNMHYCRFQNTLLALGECLGSMRQKEELSEEEEEAKQRLIEVCAEVVAEAAEEEPRILDSHFSAYKVTATGNDDYPYRVDGPKQSWILCRNNHNRDMLFPAPAAGDNIAITAGQMKIRGVKWFREHGPGKLKPVV